MNYIISDIHGEFDLLERLLKEINFSPKDTLYVLGDMIDKGKRSIKVLRFLHNLPNAICVLGNHEYDFLRYYWALCQREDNFKKILKKLQKYLPKEKEKLTWDLVDWLEKLPSFVETQNFIGVHAGVVIEEDGSFKKLEQSPIEVLLYDRRLRFDTSFSKTEKCVFFGHTPTRFISGSDEIKIYLKNDALPVELKNLQKVHLDTGVFYSGILGCFCEETCKSYYVKK